MSDPLQEVSMSMPWTVGMSDTEGAQIMGGVFGKGYKTETADTVITQLIPGNATSKARVTSLIYRVAGTAHTLTLMRPIGATAVDLAAASGQADMVVTNLSPASTAAGALEALAANDYIAWCDREGTYQYDIISSVSGNTLTMTSNLPSNVAANAVVWAFYEVGRSSHIQFNPGTSTTQSYFPNFQAGITKQVNEYNIRSGISDPLLFHSTNATAAGFLESLAGAYVDEDQFTMT
tara:strand:+ start:6650 stop:7354 length:705 start_codon:yes stop_codon:yes gene_type:complete